MSEKLLSVVLPTYNRKNYLKLTLDAFVNQMERHSDEVSFCVCNNASTDGTDQFLIDYSSKNKNFEYINFDDHVDVGYSISRANNTATGKYILMWGDDDMPDPYLLDILLDTVKRYPDAGLVHYNRLMGFDDKVTHISKLSVNDNHTSCTTEVFEDTNSFLMKHALDITFLAAFIFKNDLWKANSGGG